MPICTNGSMIRQLRTIVAAKRKRHRLQVRAANVLIVHERVGQVKALERRAQRHAIVDRKADAQHVVDLLAGRDQHAVERPFQQVAIAASVEHDHRVVAIDAQQLGVVGPKTLPQVRARHQAETAASQTFRVGAVNPTVPITSGN